MNVKKSTQLYKQRPAPMQRFHKVNRCENNPQTQYYKTQNQGIKGKVRGTANEEKSKEAFRI